jgi:TM2 domain-containing membrane protein YozV
MENNELNQLPPAQEPPKENKKMAAALCAILIGTFGVHKFILGYKTEGIIILVINLVMILITVVTCGLGIFITGPVWGIMGTLALIEGIIYLTKTDEQFYEIYQKNKRPWF